ncbi:hypothetical protein BaRGS_00010210 [Batillaria attramentaria]|uniref:EGF-like domain-containing protein n=1 Tax=Batillaria attramentaria TaxID=370345 RepID=A0ABD0LGR6_9CAEN
MSSQLFLWIVLFLGTSVAGDGEDTTVLCIGDDCDGTLEAESSQTSPPTPAITVARHQQSCTPAEEKEAACLHGECYSLDLGEYSRSFFCRCKEMYQGVRCEQICAECYVRVMRGESPQQAEIDPVLWVGIAVGVSIVIAVVVVGVVLYRRRRNTQRGSNDHPRTEKTTKSSSSKYRTVPAAKPESPPV